MLGIILSSSLYFIQHIWYLAGTARVKVEARLSNPYAKYIYMHKPNPVWRPARKKPFK